MTLQSSLADPWRPIETAPRDGTIIAASWGTIPRLIAAVQWNEAAACWLWVTVCVDEEDAWPAGTQLILQPTHWVPLLTI